MARRRSGLTNRGIILIAALLVAADVMLGLVLSLQTRTTMKEQVRARMLNVSRSAAALLDGDALASITAQDANTPAYQHAMDTLTAFQDNVELSYIYVVRQTGPSSFEFTIDPTVGDPADFGEEVHYTEALAEAAKGVSTVDLTAYHDRWGSFYSAYSPVFDSDGNVASLVGVDFSADWFEQHEAQVIRMVVMNGLGTVFIAILAVIAVSRLSTAQRQHDERMQHASSYDSLTGLAKMGHFFDTSKAIHDGMVREGLEPCILYTDLKGMKHFNQQWGFGEGNKLLRAYAQLLSEHFGHERCGRFGQDQFVVMTNAEDLEARLDALFADCTTINEGKNLPVRVGIYAESLGEVTISTACDRAKAANDADTVPHSSTYAHFSKQMLAQSELRQYVVENLDRAIAENWINVYYQPIVRAANGRVCDEEALARWIDPTRGLLSPAEFIPALEDAKLAYKLDLNVLEQTLVKMQRLRDAGLFVVPASINLSRSDFEACDIVEEVRKRVDASQIARNMINVEITETAMGSDFEFMRQQVERFHDLGLQVWMDDFGSEYSSLDYLQNLSFDLIKFDMRFMKQFDNGNKTKIILTELMRMAIGLGIDTIVEGVERADQMQFLREVGASKLQGYYFTKPLPVDAVLKRYEDGSAIGFENPAESDYFAALGSVNLYDLASIAREGDESLAFYFNTLPMAILQESDKGCRMVRCNPSYRLLIEQMSGNIIMDTDLTHEQVVERMGVDFQQTIRTCAQTGSRDMMDARLPNGTTMHALVRRVALNPVTGAAAVAIAILNVS